MVTVTKRQFWLDKISRTWEKTNLIWLYGVRRTGKTFLCRSIANAEYFDCELPRTRRLFDDPEEFYNRLKSKKIIIDEIHRLNNPSELLKIGTDYYPNIKIIATGSSTLGSSKKFKDTLTGRKKDLWLLPMTLDDLADFKNTDLPYRLHRGGLPPFFLSKTYPQVEFQEWMDDYWDKDIVELFRLERRYSFQKFIELIFMQSGGIFEANSFARPCEVSRTTIANYLKVLEATAVALVIRPYSRYKSNEIISAPKVYGFDTGFVSYFKGWESLRTEDMGVLWEHFVLNEICANLQTKKINYWRDKRGHEIDFIIVQSESNPSAIEIKWKVADFNPRNLFAFRRRYPKGKNYIISSDVDRVFSRKYNGLKVIFCNIREFLKEYKYFKFTSQ
ncbi:ATP-binding protein [Candidatus Roizmanbacteria bacterium]|nr:ATP-binding protein [Candidatus Roizmanbacteria bacterium]